MEAIAATFILAEKSVYLLLQYLTITMQHLRFQIPAGKWKARYSNFVKQALPLFGLFHVPKTHTKTDIQNTETIQNQSTSHFHPCPVSGGGATVSRFHINSNRNIDAVHTSFSSGTTWDGCCCSSSHSCKKRIT